jgi:REP element-mobilizing transposase RayT
MTVSVLPELCNSCKASNDETIANSCRFCIGREFKEYILCDLNRNIQNPQKFQCHAFHAQIRPLLSIVDSCQTRPENAEADSIIHHKTSLMDSDRLKYKGSLYLQTALKDPDVVHLDIKFHLVWNVVHRKQLFFDPAKTRDAIDEIFAACNDRIGGIARVIWLAPDHIHVFVESDGEKSVDVITKELKRQSALALTTPSGSNNLLSKKIRKIWDRAYFAETVG